MLWGIIRPLSQVLFLQLEIEKFKGKFILKEFFFSEIRKQSHALYFQSKYLKLKKKSIHMAFQQHQWFSTSVLSEFLFSKVAKWVLVRGGQLFLSEDHIEPF
jgi:hypothetical protein